MHDEISASVDVTNTMNYERNRSIIHKRFGLHQTQKRVKRVSEDNTQKRREKDSHF
jgi:hypothetical protein